MSDILYVSKVVSCEWCEEDVNVSGEDETYMTGFCHFCKETVEITDGDRGEWWEDYSDDDDVYADSQTLVSAGWGTDEDYGYFGSDDY